MGIRNMNAQIVLLHKQMTAAGIGAVKSKFSETLVQLLPRNTFRHFSPVRID